MAASTDDEIIGLKSSTDDSTAEASKEENSSKIKLTDLKVTDLRAELAKRNCDKSGVKVVLIERLKKALEEEGLDPDDFSFDSVKIVAKTLSKHDPEMNGGVENLNDDSCDTKENAVAEEITEKIKQNDLAEIEEDTVDESSVEMKDEDTDKDVPKEKDEDNNKDVSMEDAEDILTEIPAEKKEDAVNVISLENNEATELSAEKNKGTENDISLEKNKEKADTKEDETKSIPVKMKEAKELNVSSEEKNINEVTLQISIDEEDAQLNEDEGMDVSKIENEVEVKKIEEKQSSEDKSSLIPVTNTATRNAAGDPVTINKTLKESSDDKKVAKTVMTKPTESCTVSPKVLKVLGKSDKVKSSNVLAKSLWITGLPNTTRAADLKDLFSKHGRVLSVKIVKSTKQSVGKCYGFVTMANSRDATKAIQALHQTELNGRTVSVERTQSEPNVLLKKTEQKPVLTSVKKPVVKKEEKPKIVETKKVAEPKVVPKTEPKKEAKPITETSKPKEVKTKVPGKAKSKDRDQKSRERKEREVRRSSDRKASIPHPRRTGLNERPRINSARRPVTSRPFLGRPRFQSNFRPRPEQSMYERMREERIRMRERERREAERRRLEEQRYIERRQREEAIRLEREKERLRIERELLERERAEMLKLEREKQRLERERLERERDELRRQAELRRTAKRAFSAAASVPRVAERYWDDRKKLTPRYEQVVRSERPVYRAEKRTETTRYELPTRPRESLSARQEYDRRPDRYASTSKTISSRPTADFGDRDSRRDLPVRSREERPIFDRNGYRDNRRTVPASRETGRSSRRETPRDEWKQDRRISERIITPTSSSSSGQRRVNYY